jgi:hypothetical protein
MSEMFPMMTGMIIGLLIPRLPAPRWRAWGLTFLSVACGAAASWMSGELRVSLGYLVIDTAQVEILGLVMWVLTRVGPFMPPVIAPPQSGGI